MRNLDGVLPCSTAAVHSQDAGHRLLVLHWFGGLFLMHNCYALALMALSDVQFWRGTYG
jgi:hypothetical protein